MMHDGLNPPLNRPSAIAWPQRLIDSWIDREHLVKSRHFEDPNNYRICGNHADANPVAGPLVVTPQHSIKARACKECGGLQVDNQRSPRVSQSRIQPRPQMRPELIGDRRIDFALDANHHSVLAHLVANHQSHRQSPIPGCLSPERMASRRNQPVTHRQLLHLQSPGRIDPRAKRNLDRSPTRQDTKKQVTGFAAQPQPTDLQIIIEGVVYRKVDITQDAGARDYVVLLGRLQAPSLPERSMGQVFDRTASKRSAHRRYSDLIPQRRAMKSPAMTSAMPRDPRVVGGRYRSHYWGDEYTVLAITFNECGFLDAITVHDECGRRTHGTAWDERDHILFDPRTKAG